MTVFDAGPLFGESDVDGLPVFWQAVLAAVAALSGPLAILGQWLWGKWREARDLRRKDDKDRKEDELADRQRTRAERQEDDNLMIAHLREINARYVQNREIDRKEVHDLKGELDSQGNKLTLALIKLATQEVTINRMRDWIKMLEKMMDSKNFEHPKWEDSAPTGSQIHESLESMKGGE